MTDNGHRCAYCGGWNADTIDHNEPESEALVPASDVSGALCAAIRHFGGHIEGIRAAASWLITCVDHLDNTEYPPKAVEVNLDNLRAVRDAIEGDAT